MLSLVEGVAGRWTADGQAINYIAYRDGASNIFRQPIDGDPPVQVTNCSGRAHLQLRLLTRRKATSPHYS
ncbi:MAG: hypothetical protein M3410_16050 [Acidobacteriota bacterium]|nr:hypothetical protein [Acidobacteriota bacterium]